MEEGTDLIGEFLGDWFIRKCIWSSKTSIKETATSIKKFYKIMSEKGYIDNSKYKLLCEEIKEDMEMYLEILEEFDDNIDYDLY